MAAMATMTAAPMLQSAAPAATTATVSTRCSVRMGALRFPATPRARVVVRAAGNPDRIDSFVDGVKSDASKNAQNFGNTVAEAVGEVEKTVKDVGRDMGAKTQEAVDAANKKVDEAGNKTNEIGDEVSTSTANTWDAATETRSGQSPLEKAQNAAANAVGNVKQNYDYGTGSVKNTGDDVKKNAK